MRSDPAKKISPVFHLILNYLSVEELLVCAMVSHLWQSKVDTPERWQRIFFLYFPNEFRLLKLNRVPIESWMEQFRRENKLQSRHLSDVVEERFPYSHAARYRRVVAFKPHQMRLFVYCKEGNARGIESLCELLRVSDLILTDYYGFDALYYLAFHRRNDIGRILYEKVVLKKYNSTIPEPFSLLYFAVATQQSEEISRLIESGESLDKPGPNGKSPLFIASQNGDENTVSKFLQAGASIGLWYVINDLPAHIASQNGHANIVRELIQKKPSLARVANSSGNTPLYLACRNGHEEVVDILLEANTQPNHKSHNGFTPLAIAFQNGHASIVRKLLQKGADPKSLDDSCFKVVIAFGYGSTLPMIPNYLDGINYTDAQNSNNKSALDSAIEKGYGALLIPILLEHYLSQLMRAIPSSQNKATFHAVSTLRFFALGQAKKQDLEAHHSVYQKDARLRKYYGALFKCVEPRQENNSASLPELLKEYFTAQKTLDCEKTGAIEMQVKAHCGSEKNSLEPYLALALIHSNEMGEENALKFQATQLWAFELDPDWSQSKIILEEWVNRQIISREMMDLFFERFAAIKPLVN